MNNGPSLLWFRTDLRITDNPALTAALQRGEGVIGLYVLDTGADRRPLGGASLWWLRESLLRLSESLAALGIPLLVVKGDAAQLLPDIVAHTEAGAVYWNRRYGGPERVLDAALKAAFKNNGITVDTFNSHLLREPWEVRSQAGTPMKVFTPFWRAAQALGPFASPLAAPTGVARPCALPDHPAAIRPEDILRITASPDWSLGMAAAWQPGEAGARAQLQRFIDGGLTGYAEHRDRPDRENTSRLSPWLAFGEIGPRQIVAAVRFAGAADERLSARDIAKFESEIGWREFAYHLLFENPELATRNFQPKFDGFVWQGEPHHLTAWQKGQTGYPIVDAGMRQLWQTGWMHNRVRMVVASFLIKHLQIDWRSGEEWFWDTLLDADPANNAASWQWVAGSGADAAPYYRIFNPMLQGVKFDPDGDYVRTFVPELANMPAEHIHAPWEAPPATLARAGVRLGVNYPRPIVDHAAARDRAMEAYKALG